VRQRGGRRANPLLATRDGRLFLGAQGLDFMAQGVSSVALPWLILDGGGSSLSAGLVFTLGVVPYVVFGLPAGVVGDRFRRRQVMYAAHAVQGGCAAVIPLWALFEHPPLGVVLAAAFLIGSGRVFADAAAFGAIAALAGRAAFTRAQATLQAAWSAGFLVGPAVGGVLVGVIGPAETLAVEAAAFGVAVLLIVLVRTRLDPPERPPAVRPLEAMREGVAIIWRNPVVRAYTALTTCWNLCAAGGFALIVPLLRQELGLSATEVGIVLGAGAATGLVAALVAGWATERFGAERVVTRGVPLNGLAMGIVGLAPGFGVALVAYCARSLLDWVLVATFIGERQRAAPDHLQARVGITGRMAVIGSVAVGSAVVSGLSELVDLRVLYAAMAVAIVGVSLVLGPPLVRATRRAEAG
jgi:MFS family permease